MAGVEDYVQGPVDGVGKKIRNIKNTVGLNDVEQQVVTLAKSDGTILDDPATSAKQDTGNTSLSSIDGKTPALVSGRQPVDGSGVTQPVSAASLPLPTGASTAARQDTGNTSLASIDTKLPASPAAEHTTAASPNSARLSDGAAFYTTNTGAQLPAALDGSGFLKVHEQGTAAISAVSLPLPTNAATSALQTQPGVDIGDVTINNASGASAVNIQDGGNSITIDATALPLPTGAATSGNQLTEIASLANLDAALSTRLKPADTLTAVTTVGTITNVVHVDDNLGSLTVDAVSLPLPANAAQESSGNLAAITALLTTQAQILQLMQIHVAQSRATYLLLLSISGAGVTPDEAVPDLLVN